MAGLLVGGRSSVVYGEISLYTQIHTMQGPGVKLSSGRPSSGGQSNVLHHSRSRKSKQAGFGRHPHKNPDTEFSPVDDKP